MSLHSETTSRLSRLASLTIILLLLVPSSLAFGQERAHISPVAQELLSDFEHGHFETTKRTDRTAGRSPQDLSSFAPPLQLRLMATPLPVDRLELPSTTSRTLFVGQEQTQDLVNQPIRSKKSEGFRWAPAVGQSFYFLGIEHGIRLAFDPPSRAALKGKFWKDYVASLHELGHWQDGNPAFINYLGHPLQGSVTGFIQIQNDPTGRVLQFSWSREYLHSRLKAFAWSAAYSTYFEIGFPLSEAAIGNLGVDKTRRTQQGVVDLVITPTVGLGWLVMEDLIDRYVVDRYEREHEPGNGQRLMRTFLNPTRSVSNLLRFKVPWKRDDRP